MATRTFDVDATVAVAPEDAIDFLMRLDQHRGLHAYFQEAVITAQGSDAEGPWWQWRVSETPKLGPLTYRLRFPARMTRNSATEMTGRVTPAPGCSLETRTRALAVPTGAHVIETVTVTAPRPLVAYMERHARIAHVRLYSLLPAALDPHKETSAP